MSTHSPASWSAIPDADLTLQSIHDHLAPSTSNSSNSDLWAAAAAADRVVEDPTVQAELVRVGLQRTEGAVKRGSAAVGLTGEGDEAALRPWLEENDTDRMLLQLRRVLLDRSDRIRTYLRMVQVGKWDDQDVGGDSDGDTAQEKDPEDEEDGWGQDDEEDAWGDGDAALAVDADATLSSEPDPPTPPSKPTPPLSLRTFLLLPLSASALFLASSSLFPALQVLLHHHADELWKYRWTILDAVPLWEDVQAWQALVPGYDWRAEREGGKEGWMAESEVAGEGSWRPEKDFVELPWVTNALSSYPPSIPTHPPSLPTHDLPLSATELSQWYQDRVALIDSSAGTLDTALSLVQHGAGQGITGLDALGEDLSLLARAVYETQSPVQRGTDTPSADYTLADWQRMTPSEVVRAYLAGSTAPTIAEDVKRLVLPYLYVLEARAERSGTPDPGLVKRLLYSYLLSAPLHLAVALFEHSKPTLRKPERVVSDDEDVARLALAYLYGEDRVGTDAWPAMSRIFECLPAWPNVSGAEQADEAETTLSSLAAFVAPANSTHPQPSADDLLLFFAPLPRSALTHLLDVLDLHLESGEIFARWGCPAPLSWFLRSKEDRAEQRAWATRMARGLARSVGAGASAGAAPGARTDGGEGEWRNLWEDMEKLAGTEEEDGTEDEEEEDAWGAAGAGAAGSPKGLRTAFGLVGREEVCKIFFAGLLSSGNFKLAKKMLMPARDTWPLSGKAIEELVLAASHEFYDNAESGNLHSGDMKLAYDCLNVAPPSPAIAKERVFIEATSRLCSYNLVSRAGNAISPIEIRLTKDKLVLIARLLSSSEDVYKHSDTILELVDKLGFAGDDVAHVKALAMIATTALQEEDFTAAAGTADTMLQRTFVLKSEDPTGAKDPSSSTYEAITVCWQTCFQLGGQSEYHDLRRKLGLLSSALKLCPAENIPDVLAAWRKVEAEVESVPLDNALLSAPHESAKALSTSSSGSFFKDPRAGRPHTLLPNLGDLQLGASSLVNQETAAMAARTFNRVAANFTFPGNRGRTASVASEEERIRSGSQSPDLTKQARSVFTRGVGWLIGADEQELS